MAIGILDYLNGILGDPAQQQMTPQDRFARMQLGGEDTPAGGGLLDAVGQRIMQQGPQAQPAMASYAQQPQQGQGAAQVAAGDMRPQQGGTGLLGMLFGGRRSGGTNSTVQWLMNKGFDPGAAQAIASDPATLRSVVAQYGAPGRESEYQQRAQALEQAGIDPNSAEGKRYFLTGGLESGPQPTDDMREYQQAVQQGYKGTFVDYQIELRRAGRPNINTGTVPTGYQGVYDENNNLLRYDPVPGGPADLEQQAAAAKAGMRQDQATITSDTVIDSARKAREAVDSGFLPSTGTVGGWLGNTIGESNAAEVMRQTETLKAIAAAENINAMRQASPTGGALGNASDADIALLKNKAGALDPSAGDERYKTALDDYERTLLRIVHGAAAGDRIFAETRKTPQNGKTDRVNPSRFGTDSEWRQAPNGSRIRRVN